MLKEIDEKIKFEATSKIIHTKNFIKANSNYNIEHINNITPSIEFDKQKIENNKVINKANQEEVTTSNDSIKNEQIVITNQLLTL